MSKKSSGFYVVSMSLYPDRSEPEAHVALEDRFKTDIRMKWSTMIFNGGLSAAQLAEQLNKIIFDDLGWDISNDLGGITVNGASGPSPGAWTPGGGGFHEARATVQAKVATGGYQSWIFLTKIGQVTKSPVVVNVLVRFVKVTLSA